jgi:hypothetical protein
MVMVNGGKMAVKNTISILAFIVTSNALLSVPAIGQTSRPLTNSTIQAMISGGVPVATIVHTIRTAPTVRLFVNRDEIARLLNAGASANDAEQIMKAIHDREYYGMDQSPVSPVVPVPGVAKMAIAPPPAPPVEPVPVPAALPVPAPSVATPVMHVMLEDGTPVKLRLKNNLSSADANTNDTVNFDVLEEIKIGDHVVIPKGSRAWGTVISEPKKRMGRGGKLNVTLDSVRLADGEKVALRGIKNAKGNGHVGRMATEMTVTAIIVWPVAPLFLLQHGKDVTIPEGTEITAYIHGDTSLDLSKF